MKHPWRRERGVAAIEMVLVLIVGTIVLAAVILAGRLTWHAIAMHKAVASAGRIVAALPAETLTTPGVTPVVNTLVSDHIRATTQSAGLDIQPEWTVAHCVPGPVGGCGRATVTIVRVSAHLRFHDTVFDASVSGLDSMTDVDLPVTYFQTYVP